MSSNSDTDDVSDTELDTLTPRTPTTSTTTTTTTTAFKSSRITELANNNSSSSSSSSSNSNATPPLVVPAASMNDETAIPMFFPTPQEHHSPTDLNESNNNNNNNNNNHAQPHHHEEVSRRQSHEHTTLVAQLGGSGGCMSKSQLMVALLRCGVRAGSPLFAPVQRMLDALPDTLSEAELVSLKASHLFLSRALDGELVFSDFSAFISTLDKVFDTVEPLDSGELPTYIPQLAAVNPNQFGAACCSIDGQQWSRGDDAVYFCIQSIAKAITYALILEEHGADKVHQHIGREPSGAGFNERVLNADGLPHNPLINSGAIMACSLLKPAQHISQRFDSVMETWTRICGGQRPHFNTAVFLSERDTADRNFCLAYMMREEGVFPDGTNLTSTLELYFMLCSIEVTVDMLAVAAATLASGGVCPLTGDRVFAEQTVRNTLSITASCGMYDASGQFCFDIGFPAKSGVGGGLLIVIPGKLGLATFSPRLEQHGNSVRGVLFCEQLATRCDFHQFSIRGAQAQTSLSTLAQKAEAAMAAAVERKLSTTPAQSKPKLQLRSKAPKPGKLARGSRSERVSTGNAIERGSLGRSSERTTSSLASVAHTSQLSPRGSTLAHEINEAAATSNGNGAAHSTSRHSFSLDVRGTVVASNNNDDASLPSDSEADTPRSDTDGGRSDTEQVLRTRTQLEQHAFMEKINNELLFATWRNDRDHVIVCVARGADVTYADYDQRTALHVAASEGNAELVAYLLAHGADRTVSDRSGALPIDDARRAGYHDVVKLLEVEIPYKMVYHASQMIPDSLHETVQQRDERIFSALDNNADGYIVTADLVRMLKRVGYDVRDSPHLRTLFSELKAIKEMDLSMFSTLCRLHPLVCVAVENATALPNWGAFKHYMTDVFNSLSADDEGKLSQTSETYEAMEPNKFAIAVCSTTGQQLLLGDYNQEWCVDSCGKVVTYLIALELLGAAEVHTYVGKEPSGRNFNDLALDKNRRAHNPVINAGSLMIASLIKPEEPLSRRFAYIRSVWERLTGGSKVGFDNETFLSRVDRGLRCWTLAFMLLDSNAFPPHVRRGTPLNETIELFFMMTSLTCTAQQMAIVSATLANGGVNPLTGERIFDRLHVRNSLSIMASCGLYDYSGEFTFNVGMPAKSGASGGLMVVAPKTMGISIWSPRLDEQGNSVRGLKLMRRLTDRYNLHVYDILVRHKEDPTLHRGSHEDDRIADLMFAAARDDCITVRKVLALGVSPQVTDYDLRTALHVAASQGHINVVKLLLDNGVNPAVKDRWGNTPLDDARQQGRKEVRAMLARALDGAPLDY